MFNYLFIFLQWGRILRGITKYHAKWHDIIIQPVLKSCQIISNVLYLLARATYHHRAQGRLGHTPDNIIDYLMICYKFDAEENLLDYQENVIENYHATST